MREPIAVAAIEADAVGEASLQLGEKLLVAGLAAAKDGDISKYLIMNKEFKFAIYEAASNATLLFLIEILWLQVGPFLTRYADQFEGGLSGILEIDHHEEAVAALERGDGAAARAAIEQDIRDGAAYLLEHAVFDGNSED